MNLLLSIILDLLGISLIGTVLQNKISIWKNSQNMFFGCIGALVAYAFHLPIIWIVILWILCIIISCIVFHHIKTEIFDIQSNTLIRIAILVSIIIILLGAYLLIVSQFNIHIPSLNIKNIGIYLFIAAALWILFSGIRSIFLFINTVQSYNPDEFSNGDTIYIYKSFWQFHNIDYQYYNNQKINIADLKQIIHRKCKIYQEESSLYIYIDNKKYLIKELNNQEIQEGDIVKISKENLKKGMIKPNDIILVEKLQSTDKSITDNSTIIFSTPTRNHKFSIMLIIFILLGIFIIGFGFYKQYKNNEFFKNAEITTASVIDIERIDNTSGENDTISYFCDVEYTIDGKTYKSNINVTPLMSYEKYEQIKKGKKYTITVYYSLNNYLDIKLPLDKDDYSIIIIGILWTIICFIFGCIFKKYS